MAFCVGGREGIQKAIECQNVATCEYSSGLQVTGIFNEVTTDDAKLPTYLRAAGPCALAYKGKQLPGHGRDYHKEGFGSPIGNWKDTSKDPESLTDAELQGLGVSEGKPATIELVSGMTVRGTVDKITRQDGRLLLITFSNCMVRHGDRLLFDPAWGNYDMAVGKSIGSVFNGAADKDSYNLVALVPRERTIKVPSDSKRKKLENLYAQVRQIRESKVGYERLGEIWETQQAEHADDWLLSMEIFEILETTGEQTPLKARIEKFLKSREASNKELATLISWGFRLVQYHKNPPAPGALQTSSTSVN
jgi:phenylalanine-4-hydroxylase